MCSPAFTPADLHEFAFARAERDRPRSNDSPSTCTNTIGRPASSTSADAGTTGAGFGLVHQQMEEYGLADGEAEHAVVGRECDGQRARLRIDDAADRHELARPAASRLHPALRSVRWSSTRARPSCASGTWPTT